MKTDDYSLWAEVAKTLNDLQATATARGIDELAAETEMADRQKEKIALGAKLIGVIEVFFALLMLLRTPEYLMTDGRLWYTDVTVGYGWLIFLITFGGIISCLFVVALMFYGLQQGNPKMLLPHLVWQIVSMCYQAVQMVIVAALYRQNAILKPSAVVLVIFSLVQIFIQIWFIRVIGGCFMYLRRKRMAGELAGRMMIDGKMEEAIVGLGTRRDRTSLPRSIRRASPPSQRRTALVNSIRHSIRTKLLWKHRRRNSQSDATAWPKVSLLTQNDYIGTALECSDDQQQHYSHRTP